MDKFSEVDKLPKVDKAAHAGSSKVPENVREVPENESTIPLKDIADDLPPVIAGAPEVTYTKPVETTAEQPRKKIGIGGKVALGITGILIAGGAAFGVNQAVNANSAPEDNPKDTTEVTEEPGPVVSEAPVVEEEKTLEQLINENKIEAGLSPEEFAITFESKISDWALAGTSEESLEGWYDTEDKTAFEDDLAAQQTAIFTNALFAPGYHNEPSLVNVEANFETRNAAWIGSWARADATLELGSVIEETRLISEDPSLGERVVYIAGYDTNNAADANYASEETRQNALSHNGESWDHTLTLKTIDGFEYITKWED